MSVCGSDRRINCSWIFCYAEASCCRMKWLLPSRLRIKNLRHHAGRRPRFSSGCQDALLRLEYLLRGAEAGAEGSVDGTPVAGDVGVLAGEVEGVVDGHGHLCGAVCRADWGVAVGSEGVWVPLPI